MKRGEIVRLTAESAEMKGEGKKNKQIAHASLAQIRCYKGQLAIV